jgi:hypothetical protein
VSAAQKKLLVPEVDPFYKKPTQLTIKQIENILKVISSLYIFPNLEKLSYKCIKKPGFWPGH